MIAQEEKNREKDGNITTYTVKEMRILSGASATDTAAICQVSYQTLRNWESGTTIPNAVNIQDMLDIYGFTHEQLDMTPFYDLLIEKNKRKRKTIVDGDNPNRKRRVYEENKLRI